MKRSIRWYDYITISINWFALTVRSQGLVLIVPLLVQQFVGEEQKGTYFGIIRLWALMVALLVQAFMVVIVLSGMVWFVVPLYRKVIGISAYEYFEKRFGFFARMYSSIGFTLTHFSKMGTVFFLLALAIASMTGLNAYWVIWIIGIAIIFITLMGGIEAVIWLDVIQGFLLIGGGNFIIDVISNIFNPDFSAIRFTSFTE